jgi:uncharacterized DUF497 family protein
VPEYRDDRYEWDLKKSADRMARSGFDFFAARQVLESTIVVTRWDDVHSEDEDRFVATGMLHDVLISVVYTERNGRKRIISAFRANRNDVIAFLVAHGTE